MELGAFSVSLTVKDIAVSQAFYEKLGFVVFAGDISQNWLVLKSGRTVIGLFQGMFDKNTLTFNPGWDQDAQSLESFSDIRVLQQNFLDKGIEIAEHVKGESGPGSFLIVDPDGNPLLFDQHV